MQIDIQSSHHTPKLERAQSPTLVSHYIRMRGAFCSPTIDACVTDPIVCRYSWRMSSHEYPPLRPFNRSVSGVSETDAPKNHTVFHTSSVMTSLRYRSCVRPLSEKSKTRQMTARGLNQKDGSHTFSMRASALPWRQPAPLLPCEIEKSMGLPSLTMKNLRDGQRRSRLVRLMDIHTSMSASHNHGCVLFPTVHEKEKRSSSVDTDSHHREE